MQKKQARKENLNIQFKELDIKDLSDFKVKYDVILEWGLLHFIPFGKRKKYLKNIKNILNKKGIYITLSFNNKTKEWGKGKIRKSRDGLKFYFSSLKELKITYESEFKVLLGKKRTTTFVNKKDNFIHNYFVLKK